jgi:hypothetical protein
MAGLTGLPYSYESVYKPSSGSFITLVYRHGKQIIGMSHKQYARIRPHLASPSAKRSISPSIIRKQTPNRGFYVLHAVDYHRKPNYCGDAEGDPDSCRKRTSANPPFSSSR